MTDALSPFIDIAARRPLESEEAEKAFSIIMDGEATDAQIGGLLMAMRTRGETVAEFAAVASVMRARCRAVKAPPGAIDLVGTGGDGKGTLNISTAAAIVVAGAGVPVAKHGNRNLSSKSGAADVLEQLGVDVTVEPSVVEREIAEAGIGFMLAPTHHPAMRHVMTARRELGCRTIFNILGPLTNPAGAKRQLTGAFSPDLIGPMAETLGRLGSEKVWLVHGRDGTDEVSISGPTDIVENDRGAIRRFAVAPEDAGLPRHAPEQIAGGAPPENAEAIRDVLDGRPSPYRDAVALNAAAALVVADVAADLREGAAMAASAIDEGRARKCADALARISGMAN